MKIWIILISFIVAMILAILPLPQWLNLLWPDWVVLVLLYWVMVMSHKISVGYAWLLGLLLDVLFGSMLGEHALALVCVTYFITRFHVHTRAIGLPKQVLLVFVSLFVYRAILFWMQGLIGEVPNSILYWLPIVIGTVFWPWVFMLLRDCDRRLKISETQ